jgi:RES domain-containing protein
LPDLDQTPGAAVSATVYRVVRKGIDPLSSRGSELNGGRYNLPGTKGVLYASLDKVTAVAEIAKGLKTRGINPEEYGPDDWWAYELQLTASRVLDLTDQKVLEALQISAAALVADAPDLTRRIGRQALDAGYDAIIAPSAAREGGKNLVIFLSAAAPVPAVKASTPVELSTKGAS